MPSRHQSFHKSEIRHDLSCSIKLQTKLFEIHIIEVKDLPKLSDNSIAVYFPQGFQYQHTSGGSSIALIVEPAILARGEDDYQAEDLHAARLNAAVVINDQVRIDTKR